MSTKTKIEWTDATWNPIRGCSRVSEGCRNCYAEAVAGRFSERGQAYEGVAELKIIEGKFRGRWTGKVGFVKEHLEDPIRWRKPRRIFVNSMSDLFHEGVKNDWIASIFSVIEASRRHTFQILTKRPNRMRIWIEEFDRWLRYACGVSFAEEFPHVWLGVSVEDQATADERIPLLLQTPAAVRWVSYEPALEPVNFEHWLSMTCRKYETDPPNPSGCDGERCKGRRLDWVVVGGESGPGARPFSLRWARSVVKDCQAARVPVFVKQLGARPGTPSCADFDCTHPDCGVEWLKLKDRKGGDPSEWPEDLRVREYPKEAYGE